MSDDRVLVVGAGVGGLSCAIQLAARGLAVAVIEAAETPGGKIRTLAVGDGAPIDCGPTVLTMRWVFDELFAQARARLDDLVHLQPLRTLARHAWVDGSRLDLHADRAQAADAIGVFAGADAARGYLAFCDHARDVYGTLLASFMTAERPTPAQLVRRAGFAGLLRAGPFTDMWGALGRFFADPRLRQLFGRYATYCGSSPFLAPATLMLVAHVEQEGVWTIEGGTIRLAEALRDLAVSLGTNMRFDSTVAQITTARGRVSGVRLASGEIVEAGAVVLNADANALATGRFGRDVAAACGVATTRTRSLSAVTFALRGHARGIPLVRHNVFFSSDYRREFEDLFQRRTLSDEPTVYICAQDRGDEDRGDAPDRPANAPERLFAILNAPAIGDSKTFTDEEVERCQERMSAVLHRCGLTIEPTAPPQVTTPTGFEALFPATGGALYGPATHGAMATFARPSARTKLPGLYLAGGSVHPGPGVPMAALSGRIAAEAILRDRATTGLRPTGSASTRPSRPAATPGGTSMR